VGAGPRASRPRWSRNRSPTPTTSCSTRPPPSRRPARIT
jgi:hypothetical protein